MAMNEVRIEQQVLRAISEAVLQTVNNLQGYGFTPDELITALLFTCGLTLKQRGALLDAARPSGQMLPPLMAGYNVAQPVEKSPILQRNGFVN